MATASPQPNEDVTAEMHIEALDPMLGVTLDGRFRIVGMIGGGAMGKVYRAVQLPLNRAVAVKVLDSNYGAGRDEAFRQRFLVESALTAKLSHPNTVRIIDYGCTAEGVYYLAMEYLDGQTLDTLLAAKRSLPWKRAADIAQQVARALKEAHELGVVHRDLKPANVMILDADDRTDHVKVLDFGLVKSFVEGQDLEGRAITQQGMLVGSPPYMAPEQGDRNRADPRSDIYSLGTVLFEMLTGAPPYSGKTPIDIILKHVHEPIPPVTSPVGAPPIPPVLVTVVQRCLAKSPMDRFQSMDDVISAIQSVVDSAARQQVITRPTLPPTHSGPSATMVALLVLVGLSAMAIGVFVTALIMHRPAPPPPPVVAVQPAKPSAERELIAVTPAVTQVELRLASEPPGALVTLGGKPIGRTPVTATLPASDGRASAEVTFALEGYVPLTVTAAGSGPRLEITQRLQRVATPAAQKPVAKPARHSLPPKRQKK